MTEVDWLELPFEEAIRHLRGLRPTPKAYFEAMTFEARRGAFTIAKVTKMEVLQRALDYLQDTVESGGSMADFIDLFESKTLTAGHLETVFRTNTQAAYGKGLWDQGRDSDISDALWGWRYHTVGDDRVREEHEDLDGEVFATGQGDAVWPPWDFNCRCSAEWITNTEAEEEGYESAQLSESVQEALGSTEFASPALETEYAPDLAAYDAGLVSEYVSDQEE